MREMVDRTQAQPGGGPCLARGYSKGQDRGEPEGQRGVLGPDWGGPEGVMRPVPGEASYLHEGLSCQGGGEPVYHVCSPICPFLPELSSERSGLYGGPESSVRHSSSQPLVKIKLLGCETFEQ